VVNVIVNQTLVDDNVINVHLVIFSYWLNWLITL